MLIFNIIDANCRLDKIPVVVFHWRGATCLLQVDVAAQDEGDHADDDHSPGSKALRCVLVGQFEENHSREDDTNTGAHGAPHKAEDQFNVGDENSDGETEDDETAGDDVEPCRWNVVSDQLGGADALVSFPEEQTVDAGPAGEHHQGEGERHGDTEAQLDGLDEGGVREGREDVTTEVSVTESDVAEEADGDVDGGAEIDCSLHHLSHLGRGGVRELGVHLEHVCLTGERHGEDGEALEHSGRSPEVDFRCPLTWSGKCLIHSQITCVVTHLRRCLAQPRGQL